MDWKPWASGDTTDEAEVVALFGLVPLGIVSSALALPIAFHFGAALATGYVLSSVALLAMLVLEPELPRIPSRAVPAMALPGELYAHA